MGEDGRAVALDMLVEPDTGAGLGHDRCERGLADRKRVTPHVVAIQLDQVESVEEGVQMPRQLVWGTFEPQAPAKVSRKMVYLLHKRAACHEHTKGFS